MTYKKLLMLSYLCQKGRSYVLSDIQKILGLTLSQLENIINSLINENYLEYRNNMLEITDKGAEEIIINNFERFPFSMQDDYIHDVINKSEMMAINEVYLSNKFIKSLK